MVQPVNFTDTLLLLEDARHGSGVVLSTLPIKPVDVQTGGDSPWKAAHKP